MNLANHRSPQHRSDAQQPELPRPTRCKCPAFGLGSFVFLVLGGLVLAGLFLAQPSFGEVVNRVLLRVNDRIITLFDYQMALAERRSQILRSETDPSQQRSQLQEAPLQVMRSLFDRLLVFSRADQLGLTVGEIEVDEAVAFQLEQNGIEDQEQLRSALLQSGMTMDQFRAQLRERLLWERVTARELLQRIQVSDEQLRQTYERQADRFVVPEERKLREVVVLDSSDLGDSERQSLAEQLRADWLAGSQPDELAGADGSTTTTFIDIGWVKRDDLNQDLAAVAFALEPGEVSAPFASRGGLHVVQNLETKEASRRPFQEVRDQLLRFERARRYEEELDDYLAELEERSYFRSDLPAELQDFRTKSGRTVREEALQIFAPPTADTNG